MLKNFKRGLIGYQDLYKAIAQLKSNPDYVWTEEDLEALEYVGEDYLQRR